MGEQLLELADGMERNGDALLGTCVVRIWVIVENAEVLFHAEPRQHGILARRLARSAPLLAVPSPKKLMLTWLAVSSFRALCTGTDTMYPAA